MRTSTILIDLDLSLVTGCDFCRPEGENNIESVVEDGGSYGARTIVRQRTDFPKYFFK